MFDNHETQSITKLLVFEFITGGGFSQEALPDSLATEGLLMLEVMIEELALVPAIQITVLLDWRFNQLNLPLNINAVVVAKDQSVYEILPALIEQADFIWPIAPEMDSILKKITALVEDQGKGLLNSSSEGNPSFSSLSFLRAFIKAIAPMMTIRAKIIRSKPLNKSIPFSRAINPQNAAIIKTEVINKVVLCFFFI